jgi:hypothetical protein
VVSKLVDTKVTNDQAVSEATFKRCPVSYGRPDHSSVEFGHVCWCVRDSFLPFR